MENTSHMNETLVWDPLIRLFHWTLVASFTIDYLTGETLLDLHIWVGYLIAGLLAFRIIWGFIGPQHARFSDFVCPPRVVIDYLKSLVSGHPQRYLGHNPAGGLMVLALLVSLGLTTITGILMVQTQEPVTVSLVTPAYADDDDDDHEYREHHDDEDEEAFNEAYEEIHEFFANLTLLLVLLHIAGVIVSSRLHRENLVRAMITGRKPPNPES